MHISLTFHYQQVCFRIMNLFYLFFYLTINVFYKLKTGFYDTRYHRIKINQDIISVITKAGGKKGTFQRRDRSAHNGFLSYLGKRSRDSQSQPSPSEGPSEHLNQHGFWYYRNTINHLYRPKTLHLFNDIARAGSNVAYYLYKHLRIFYNHKQSSRRIFFGIIMIATINFSCTSHCDEKDVLPDDETNEMVTKVSEILNSNKTTDKNRYNEAKCTLDSQLSWGCCVPTTCCYQHVQSNTTHPVDIIQYFCIPTLGVCYQIKHYWLHCFLAGFFHITHLLSYLLRMG